MNQEVVNKYMTLGMYTGIYMMSSALAEDEPEWLRMKESAANDIQRLSGMPAEDFANMIDGMIAEVRANIKKTRDGQ